MGIPCIKCVLEELWKTNSQKSQETQVLSYLMYTRDVRNELLIVLYLDIHVGHDKTNIYLSRFIQGLQNGV